MNNELGAFRRARDLDVDRQSDNATPVPMATEQLCNEAKNKLFESYRRTNTPNFVIVIECLKAR